MSNKDFQNGFIAGAVSGGVVEVEDTTKMDALEDLIDNSGVLEDTEGSVSEKVEELIEKIQSTNIPPNASVVFDYHTDGDYVGEVKKITINRSTAIPSYMFSDNKTPNKYYNYVEEVELNDEITEIGELAFGRMASLKKVKLPSLVIKIDSAAFTSSALEELLLPETLQTIGGYCFESGRFESLVFPKALRTIGSASFQNCGSLKAVYFKGTPTSIASNSFPNRFSLTDIYCPWEEGAVANAPWGATIATIHYNWVEGEEANADS